MPSAVRKFLPWLFPAMLVGAAAWALSIGTLPPAEFTFCNATEIKSVDPHRINGQPEGRIVEALFEPLLRRHPETLQPIPGMAERWKVSDDLKTYTFHIRRDALWSDGTPLTAEDFYYSFRRFLLPATGGEYTTLFFAVKNSEKYTKRLLKDGDPVEVELPKPAGAVDGVRGEILTGKLLKIEGVEPEADDHGASSDDRRVFVVEIDGKSRRFTASPNVAGAELCQTVLFDFREVGVKLVDSHTLQLVVENPTPYFLDVVSFYPLAPVQRRCVEQHGYPNWTKPENIVTNGAYRLQFRRIRDRIRLVKSDTYWNRANVKLNTIDALAAENITTMLNLYLTGKADWVTDLPPSVKPELRRTRPLEYDPTPQLSVYFYRVNVTRKPLNDVRVRRALSMALNRKEIIEAGPRAGEVPALSLVPEGIAGYTPANGDAENISQAKRLLAEAGYPEGRGFPRIEILYNSHDVHRAIAEVIQSQWKRNLGITVGLVNQEWGTFNSTTRKLEYDVSRAGWIGDYNDPTTFLDLLISNNENNQTGWKDAEYDELMTAASREVDPAKRFKLLHDAEQRLVEQLPVIPMYHYVSKEMVRTYVKGLYSNIREEHPLWAVSIDPEEKARVFAAEGLR
jgi:oligopeptide transport system substrate-binding protein